MTSTDDTTGHRPYGADLTDHQRATIGPRQPGMTCRSGYWHKHYTVDAVLLGDDARAHIPWSDIAIVETDLDGLTPGRQRVHCTPWDPSRDIAEPDGPVA